MALEAYKTVGMLPYQNHQIGKLSGGVVLFSSFGVTRIRKRWAEKGTTAGKIME
jgi:hypothetical protein